MTAEQFRRRQPGGQESRANKFSAEKVAADGHTFDSKREYRRYLVLRDMMRHGLITDLELQVRIPLHGRDGPLLSKAGRQLVYVADFTYTRTEDGESVIEDAKGMETPLYKLKRAILAAQGVEVTEV